MESDICNRCGFSNEPKSHYCGGCGQDLRDVLVDVKKGLQSVFDREKYSLKKIIEEIDKEGSSKKSSQGRQDRINQEAISMLFKKKQVKDGTDTDKG